MTFPLELLIGLAVSLFTAGITWGIMQARQSNSEEKSKVSENRIDILVKDLQDAVRKLDGIGSEFQVWKAASVRYEKDIEDHDKRIKDLEIAMAKRSTTRKRY